MRSRPLAGTAVLALRLPIHCLLILCLLTLGCGTYDEKPVAGPTPPAAADATTNDPASGPPGENMPNSGAPVQRQRLDQAGVRRVPLTDVVGVFLNAKASINQRMLSLNAHQVAEQFKAQEGRYPNDYAELEVRLKAEGKALPDLSPGNHYVFDPSDGNVYVESGG